MKYKKKKVKIPNHDFDLVLTFHNGKEVIIQARPSNADVDYNGSLDIILPENMHVANWAGDEMKPAKAAHKHPEIRFAKQLVTELP